MKSFITMGPCILNSGVMQQENLFSFNANNKCADQCLPAHILMVTVWKVEQLNMPRPTVKMLVSVCS